MFKLFVKLFLSITLVFSAAIIGLGQICPSSAGCLDSTFGSSGIANVLLPENNSNSSDTVTQSDGKVVTFGQANGKHRIFRLNPDGSLDTTFGNGGSVAFNWWIVKGNTTYWGNANGIAIQNINGTERIVIAGTAPMMSGSKIITARLRVDRFMPDGSYDPSFGVNGVKQIDIGSAYTVAIQPSDQKILTVGTSYGELVRLNVNGTLDTTFGTGGKVQSGNGQVLRFDSSGRILMAGLYDLGTRNQPKNYVSVRRFLPNGRLDTTFGNNGLAFGFPTTYRLFGMEIDPFGNIVVGGTATNLPTYDFIAARFTPNGAIDSSFSGDGIATADLTGRADYGNDLVVQSDGKIVLTGQVVMSVNPYTYDVGVARFSFDGSLDNAFGTAGKFIFDTGGDDLVRHSVLQIDPACACEKIVIASFRTGYLAHARVMTF